MRKIDKYFDRLQEWLSDDIGSWTRDRRMTDGFVGYLVGCFMCLTVFLLCSLLTSCKYQQPIVSSQTSQQTIISERYDSAHSVAGDSATAALLFRCDSLGNVYLANLHTEQGKRLRLELLLTSTQQSLDSIRTAGTHSLALSLTNTTQADKSTNQPLFVKIDCKEDSFEVVIRGLRERIAYIEENDTTRIVVQKVVPTYYKNMARGFWTMFVLLLLALALLVWKNYGKIAAFFIKLYAKLHGL